MMGVGVVARTSEGRVLACMRSVQQYIFDPAVAEAYGARQAAEFGRFLGLNSVLLEGDALAIILALGRIEVDDGNYGSLIMDARNILQGFGSWGLSHIRREGNMVAHTCEVCCFI